MNGRCTPWETNLNVFFVSFVFCLLFQVRQLGNLFGQLESNTETDIENIDIGEKKGCTVTQWLALWPHSTKVLGLIPGKGTYLSHIECRVKFGLCI